MSTIYNNGTEYGGGTTNYNDLSNKPKIGGVELSGNKTISQLGGVQSFNGRSGSVLPMAGDYSAEQVNYDSNQTVKQKIDALVTKEASDIAGQQSLVKDTVGFTGKNLLKNTATTQTINGVTFTVNDDKSVTVNGTAGEGNAYLNIITPGANPLSAGTYKASGCPANGNLNTYILFFTNKENTNHYVQDSGNGGTFALNDDIQGMRCTIRIYAGYTANNLTFYPMIRHADITDPTYEPYHESVEEEIEQIHAGNGVLGAKNLLPYTRDSSTYTQSGVTYTRNADGSITANGTATANSFLPIAERIKHLINNLKKGVEYILSGDYGLGSGNGYVYINFYNGSTRIGGVNTGGMGSVKFKIPESVNGTAVDDIDFGIGVLNGKTVNNFTFYPMLRLASDPDYTYQPYAMTNRELTEKAVGEKHTATITTGTTGNWASTHTISTIRRIEAYAKGYIVIPFVNANGTWFLKVLSTEMQPVASQSIEVTYWTFAV